ncbi:hypothetical protein [Brevundimonas nasdae]|uniref:hypothetical protein n=1 Tax=Brevundimonas nasdae TaxID=172043 RepID=UPI0028A1D889|nr:hypothetical protein [Brevundimonas nasdae]
MNVKQHALVAKALIDANGGVDACCKPTTRVERSALYAYQNEKSGLFMPADVIDALETRCKNPLYSMFLASQIEVTPDTNCVVQEAADVDEAGNDVWRYLRRVAAEADPAMPLSENNRREAERLLQRLDREVAELRAVVHGTART